jgi:beta-lactamase superfamily II metal-dependent hydrolase
MTLILFGWALKRPTDLLNSLAAAALIILAWDPQELFAPGFQLSFLVVLIIGLMLPPLNLLVDRWLAFDPLVPAELVPGWRKGRRALLRTLLRYLALSLAAWIGSIPLSAKYFNLFSPVSPLANVVAVPLGAGALTSIMGSLGCGAWCPGAAVLFNHSAWFFMVALMRVSELASDLPGAFFYVAAPSWPLIGLYYTGLVAGLTGRLRLPKQKFALTLAATGLTAAVALCLWSWASACREVRLTVLPLNGSPAVYVTGPGAANRWLINCGNEAGVDGTLKPFLHAQGVNHVAQLILTTGEAGDSGGAARLDQELGVTTLFTSDLRFRSAPYRALTARFDQTPGRHRILRLNDTAGSWRVLHPGPADNFPRGDDNALVLRGRFYQAEVLFLADLGRNGQSVLLERTNDLRADIVIAGLPAEGEPLCDALLQAVRPQVIVLVDSEYPAQRRAGPRLKTRLEHTGRPVIYTREAGAVTLVSRPAGWELTTTAGQRFDSDGAGDENSEPRIRPDRAEGS